MSIYSKDDGWYVLVFQNGLPVEMGPFSTASEARINGQMTEQFSNNSPPEDLSGFNNFGDF